MQTKNLIAATAIALCTSSLLKSDDEVKVPEAFLAITYIESLLVDQEQIPRSKIDAHTVDRLKVAAQGDQKTIDNMLAAAFDEMLARNKSVIEENAAMTVDTIYEGMLSGAFRENDRYLAEACEATLMLTNRVCESFKKWRVGQAALNLVK
jgi:hypothetical protein